LEREIIKRLVGENAAVRERSGYELKVGTRVQVYNAADPLMKRRSRVKPELRTVVGYNGAAYVLRKTDGTTEIQPRFKLREVVVQEPAPAA
jgi:hypothetical protein